MTNVIEIKPKDYQPKREKVAVGAIGLPDGMGCLPHRGELLTELQSWLDKHDLKIAVIFSFDGDISLLLCDEDELYGLTDGFMAPINLSEINGEH